MRKETSISLDNEMAQINTAEAASPTDYSELSYAEFIASAQKYGILSKSDISKIILMNKKQKISEVHSYAIWQGKGSDKRWKTWIADDSRPEGRRRIAFQTETEIIDYLYELYFQSEKSYEKCTLTDIYEEWIQYKLATVNRANTVHRIETDYIKYYLNEPLSLKIISTPLMELTIADIKMWAYSLIKKYELTKKSYNNIMTVLRQVFNYLIEKEVTERNTCKLVKIEPSAFKKSLKKPAETQIFYADEIALITKTCIEKAKEEADVAYLAIPLFFLTGLRIGECLALSYEDCLRKDNLIHVYRMLAVKDVRLPDGTWKTREYEIVDFLKGNGDPRDVIVSEECFEIIDLIKEIQKSKLLISKQLFPNITMANVQCKLYRLCDALELTKRSPHKWRKTYISTLLNNGVDPDFVRAQVGHKDLQTTLNSYDYSTTRKEKQISQLEKILVI